MRWWWRSVENPASQGDHVDLRESEADEALREAQRALNDVREKKKDGYLIAGTLAAIRKTNHFQEMWNEGLRGG